ncbi:UBN2 [Branchiostoma lanceolatum]|uniref:UBN2 protein n=1 Tax=Branchiostoma lanceolatum TaxID=7740 RepID=A0A8K0A726_BRALA|nr:UBN2 [Branchiostoma lanceolatum]
MAEAKRIVPIPLKGMKPLSKEKKEKSSPPRAPTLRFALSLTASTDKTCPELSYVDLVRNAMCKDKDSRPTPNKDVQVIDPDDPFAAADAKEMDDVERIARHFEEKYGPSTVSKVKGRRRDRIEDLVDMGLGYDETDPFVDNSECYDELVPADITTKLGGFYINSGVLEFRDVSDSDSEGNFKAPGVKRKTPKILSDSDDSGGDFKDATKKKRKIRKPSKDGVEKDGVRKRKRLKDPLDPNKPKKPRKPREKGDGTTKPRKKSTPTVAELLQRQQQLHQPGQNPLSTSNSTSPPSAGLQLHNSNVSPSNLLNSAGFGTLGFGTLGKHPPSPPSAGLQLHNSTSPPSAGLQLHNSTSPPSAGFGTLGKHPLPSLRRVWDISLLNSAGFGTLGKHPPSPPSAGLQQHNSNVSPSNLLNSAGFGTLGFGTLGKHLPSPPSAGLQQHNSNVSPSNLLNSAGFGTLGFGTLGKHLPSPPSAGLQQHNSNVSPSNLLNSAGFGTLGFGTLGKHLPSPPSAGLQQHNSNVSPSNLLNSAGFGTLGKHLPSPPSAGLQLHNSNVSPSNLLNSAGFGTLGLQLHNSTSPPSAGLQLHNSTSPPSAGLQLHNSNVSPSNLLNSAGFGTLGFGTLGKHLPSPPSAGLQLHNSTSPPSAGLQLHNSTSPPSAGFGTLGFGTLGKHLPSPPSAGLPQHNSNVSPSNLLNSAGFGTLGFGTLGKHLPSPPSAGLPQHNSNVSPSNLLNSAGFGTLGDAASSLLSSSILSGLGDGSQGGGDGINPEKPPNLPTGLPGDLQTTIVKLKEAAEMSSDGKCKFFTPSVNSMLLDVEMQSRELKCSERSGVFAHLAAHLPCTKDTLLKRAKKLRHSELDSQLREPLFRLREAIGKVMPDQIRRHQEECKIATQAKLEQLQESQQTLQKDGEQENAGSTSDEDEEGNKNSLDNIKIKRSSMPRRKFEWTDEIRKLLYEVVRIKVQHYDKFRSHSQGYLKKLLYEVVRIKVQHYDRSRSQSAEEYLKTYMEQEVKNCWPKGWMQARMLFKESRCIHSCITAQPPKQKKIQVNPAPKKTAIIKFGLDHPPHVWGWSQQVGQTDPWDPAVSRQERKAPSPVVLPSGAVVAGGNIGGSNSTPPRTSPSQTFPKPVPMATSSSALQSMSLFASCVAAEKQQVTSVVSSPPSALPNAPTLTSSISSFIPTLLDYADLDGKMKPKETSPRLGDSPTDNSIGHAIDAVVRQARSHSQPAQDLTAAVKTSPPQQTTSTVKKPASDVVRPTMKSPPNASSQVQQQQRPSSAEMRSQFGKSFQALFEQSIQQPAGFNYPLARQGEGSTNSQPARQQAAAPHKVPTTTSPYAQFQAHTQSSQPKAKPLSFVKPHYQTSTQSQAPLFSSKSQPQTATQAPLYSSKSQPQTATQAPLYSSKSQPQTSPQAPLYSSKGQPLTSPQASMFSSKSQTQTSPQAPLYSSKGQPQTSPQAPLYSSKGQSYPSQSQGQTSPFDRTTQGSPKIGMSLTHGNQASLTHGNQASLTHGNQASLTHGNQASLAHGTQSSLAHSSQSSLAHSSQSSLTHGNQSSLTHSNQSSSTHGNQPSLTHSNQSSLTHTNQSSLTHGSQSSLTHGNQARQSGLSHSSPNLSPHGQGYNSTSPLSHQKSTGYTPTSPLSHQKSTGYTPTSPLSHQKPTGYTPTSPLSHQKPGGYTPTSPLSHQKPTGYSSSSPKFTSSSLASMGGIAPDLSSFQLPGLNSIPQTTQRGSGRPSLSQSQLTHPTTQALPVYQMGLADPRRDQASPAGGQRVVSDAIITGPAPGTYNHVQAYGPGRGTSSKVKGQPPSVNFQGGSLPPFGTLRSSPTRQPYPGNQFSQAFSEAKNQSHSSSNNSTSPHRQIQ